MKDLIDSLHEYLADECGVDDEFICDMNDFIFNKEYAEYRNLLDNLKKFIA